LIVDQPLEELDGSLLLSEQNEGGSVAKFIRRVRRRRGLAPAAALELFPVALEGSSQRSRRQARSFAAGIERDRGRRRIEVTELDRAGNEIDAQRCATRTGLDR
jgi:hypothetical protein